MGDRPRVDNKSSLKEPQRLASRQSRLSRFLRYIGGPASALLLLASAVRPTDAAQETPSTDGALVAGKDTPGSEKLAKFNGADRLVDRWEVPNAMVMDTKHEGSGT